MKKEYTNPEFIIVEYSLEEDIMTTSKDGGDLFSMDNYGA